MTRIIAISGSNIAILAGILMVVVRPLFDHRGSGWFALLGIGLPTVLVSVETVVLRAIIMGELFVNTAYLWSGIWPTSARSHLPWMNCTSR